MSLASRYTILRKIADGGTAEIFLAKQHGAQGFEKSVVLKRIFTTFYADPQFRHMLVDEAHVAMTLNHSNIVQVLDLGEAEGRYFLALELVDGWTLDRVLAPFEGGRRAVPARARALPHRRGLPGARLRARQEAQRRPAARHRPPRHQPAQRAGERAGRGEDHRLRHRQGADAQGDRAPAT